MAKLRFGPLSLNQLAAGPSTEVTNLRTVRFSDQGYFPIKSLHGQFQISLHENYDIDTKLSFCWLSSPALKASQDERVL
jgi:hypothetical protein